MLDRLKTFISSLSDQPRQGEQGADDPRIAAAALMFHIVDADGVRGDLEAARLREVLADAYALGGAELDKVIRAGEKADREAVDLFAFTSVLNRRLDEQAKVDFVGLLWEIVFADGEMHELEDNIVWRIAELIGVSPRDRVLARRKVREEAGMENG